VTTAMAALVLMGMLLAFSAGAIVGRVTAPRRGPISIGRDRPAGPAHRDLHYAKPVWFPWKSEWKRGRINGPDGAERRYYTVHCYDLDLPNRDVRVAHLDLRIDNGEPLSEMCPPMSIVEFEQEMGT
jgi:hypothetical protein